MQTTNQIAAPRLTLQAETAAELMMCNPVSLRAQASVDEARELFRAKRISAAPVIDEAGRPVGVLSDSDIIIHDAVRPMARTAVGGDYDEGLGGATTAARLRTATPDISDLMVVEDLMTPAVLAVDSDTSAAVVVSNLLEFRIHHLFVVDSQGVLIGVISTLDVLRQLRT